MSGAPPLPSEAAADDPAREARELQRFVDRTSVALGQLVDDRGVLHDPVAGRDSPPDHYAATFTALALALRDASDGRVEALLGARDRLDARQLGHAPFNRLALLLLRDVLQRCGALTVEAQAHFARRLAACRLQAVHPSNNWMLLTELCRLLESPAEERSARGERFAARCAALLTPAGAFIDFPAAPGDGPVCTPLAYHAKCALLLALARQAAPEAPCGPLLARALGFLLAFTDEDGAWGGFGRSTHALYGSGAVLVIAALGLRGAAVESQRRAWAVGARRLRLLLEQQRRDDGLLGLNLAPATGAAGGWDGYMHATVYNAWTAGLLGWALRGAAEPPLPAPDTTALGTRPAQLALDRRAGLLAVRGPRGSGLISLAGQPVQGRDERIDLRWAGLMPFHGRLDGKAVVAPPTLLAPALLARQPALAGFTPCIAAGGRLYFGARWPQLDVHAEGARVAIAAAGPPVELHPAGPSWFVRQLDHYLLRGRRARAARLHPPALGGHRLAGALVWDAHEGWCAAIWLLRGAVSSAVLRNPHGRALLPAGARLPQRGARWEEGAPGLRPVALGAAEIASPCAVRDGCVGAEAPEPWPAHDRLLVTVIGPRGAALDDPLPLRYDPVGRQLVLSWTSLTLE